MNVLVQYDADDGLYLLMVADGKMRPMPAGPRLFHPPEEGSKTVPTLPVIRFAHADAQEAEVDAAVLRGYLGKLKR